MYRLHVATDALHKELSLSHLRLVTESQPNPVGERKLWLLTNFDPDHLVRQSFQSV